MYYSAVEGAMARSGSVMDEVAFEPMSEADKCVSGRRPK